MAFLAPVSVWVGAEGLLGREWDTHPETVATADSGHEWEERRQDGEWMKQDLWLSLCGSVGYNPPPVRLPRSVYFRALRGHGRTVTREGGGCPPVDRQERCRWRAGPASG